MPTLNPLYGKIRLHIKSLHANANRLDSDKSKQNKVTSFLFEIIKEIPDLYNLWNIESAEHRNVTTLPWINLRHML